MDTELFYYALVIATKAVLIGLLIAFIAIVIYIWNEQRKREQELKLRENRITPNQFTEKITHGPLWALQDCFEKHKYMRGFTEFDLGAAEWVKADVTVIVDLTTYPYDIKIEVSSVSTTMDKQYVKDIEKHLIAIKNNLFTHDTN